MATDDLRRKVKFLKGVLGHALDDQYLVEQTIAKRIGTTPAQWARKSTGVVGIGAAELCRLLVHFKLDDRFDWRVFELPYDAFVTAMQDAKVGTYGLNDGIRALQRLLSDPLRRSGGVRVKPAGLRAGLGAADEGPAPRVVLAVGARATIHVETPGPGNLLVLNQHLLSGETNCLVPSSFWPTQAVRGGEIKIPDESAPQTAFTVGGPIGEYRVLAIWARQPIGPTWLAATDTNPRILREAELRAIADDILSRPKNGSAYTICTGGYRVAG